MLKIFLTTIWDVLKQLVSLVTGRSDTAYVHGIPNLVQVAPGLWRSGQPTTPDQWQYLKSLGITRVVKLNYEEEGTDQGAIDAGLTVHVFSIPPKGDLKTVVEKPDYATIMAAEAVMESSDGVLVHCTHGQDRTGLTVGVYRVKHDHHAKGDAWLEMLNHGFHPELVGLDAFWEDFQEK